MWVIGAGHILSEWISPIIGETLANSFGQEWHELVQVFGNKFIIGNVYKFA